MRVSDKAKVMADPRLGEAVREAEARLGGRGRVNVRPSGTEPVVRIIAEAPTEPIAMALCHDAGKCVV